MHNNIIRVLIADDKLEECEIIEKNLKNSKGIEVCGFSCNGEDALKKIYELTPDVVLLDVMMPCLDGIGVLRKIKENPPSKDVKVIMVTGADKNLIIKEAYDLGASYYLIKPIDFSSLPANISMVFGMTVSDQGVSKDIYSSKLSLARRKLLDLEAPTHLVGYSYALQSIDIMMSDVYQGNLSKQVYNRIAIENDTTPECVESAIRSLTSKIAEKNNELFQRFFVDDINNSRRPSNLKFLTRIVEEIKLRDCS